MKGKITSLDPPMVTAEVEKPQFRHFQYKTIHLFLYGIRIERSPDEAYKLWRKAMQEYHKAIEPMPIENVIGNIICLEDCSNEWIKLNLKVLFIKTETGCRVTKIS